MPYDMGMMLTNDQHIKPLLHYYLSELIPSLRSSQTLDEEAWEHVESPDGNIASFRLDVVAGGRSGAMNIRDGYLRALALCLQKGTTPRSIRLVSIINHEQLHWTCSVADIELNPGFIANLKAALEGEDLSKFPTFRVVNLINELMHPDASAKQIENDLALFGTSKVKIRHYDSHNPDPDRYIGSYYQSYRSTLDSLISANSDKAISVKPAKCKGQKGNTCGDNALWNGFMAGVLALNPKEEFVQVDSTTLRAFSEHQVADLQSVALKTDVKLAAQVRAQVQENIALSKQFFGVKPAKPSVTKRKEPEAKAPEPKVPEKKQSAKEKRESQLIFFTETSKKNKNVNKLLHHFGEDLDTIRHNIKQEYTHKKTERGITGFFQRLNIKIGNVASKRRKQQMDQLASLINMLQNETLLNNHEKGIILQGLLKEIIDDIALNEPKNWYNSRLSGMCKKLNQDLKRMEITNIDTQKAKRLFHVYVDDGARSFRNAASQYVAKPSRKLGK